MNRRNQVIVGALVIGGLAVLGWRMRSARKSQDKAADTKSADQAAQEVRTRSARPDVPDPHTSQRGTISGTVRDQGDTAIAGAQVCANASSDHLANEETHEPTCARSDADGRYSLSRLHMANYVLSASARDHIPRMYRGPAGRSTIHLGAGENRGDVDFNLRKGGVEVRGTVLDIGGGPVANALVSAGSGRFSHQGTSFARSDEQGAFTLWVQAGPLSLSATADGYARGEKAGSAPGQHMELLLTPESILAGVVRERGTKKPVAGALVKVGEEQIWRRDQDQAGFGSAVTDADGRFRITRLAPGRYKARATATGRYGEAEESVLLGLGQTRDSLVVEVHPAFVVGGAITVADSDEPCPTGSVRMTAKDSDREASGSTEGDGAVTMKAVLPGTYRVDVFCKGWLPRASYPDIEVTDGDVTGLSWQVDKGAEIAGRVVDQDGQPVVDAWIRARGSSGDPRGQRSWAFERSEDDGRFSLTGLLAGKYDLEVQAEGHPEAKEPTEVDLSQQPRAEVELKVETGGTIVGTVRDETGAPVTGVEVSAQGERWFSGATYVKDDGTFEILGVRAGKVRVVASRSWTERLRAPGQSDDDAPGAPVTVVVGQKVSVDLVVESQSGEISGRILDQEGNPVSDGYVSAQRESEAAGAVAGNSIRRSRWSWGNRKPMLSDPEGRFTVGNLSRGTYTLRAYRRGGGEAFAEGVALGSDIVLTLLATGSISGSVTRDDEQVPEEFTISITDSTTGFSRSERFFRPEGGAFVMRDIPAGDFTVSAIAAEGVAKAQVALTEGQVHQGLSLSLESRSTVEGRLVELDSETPVPGMMVMVRPQKGAGDVVRFSMGGSAEDNKHISGADGRFTVERAPAGKVRITAIPLDFRNSPYDFTLLSRTLRGGDTLDLGDIPVPRRRIGRTDRGGDLGYELKQRTPGMELEDFKLEIALVREDGPAASSGLEVGDIVEAVDGHAITGQNLYIYRTLTQVAEGTTITLGLSGGKTVSITAGPPR